MKKVNLCYLFLIAGLLVASGCTTAQQSSGDASRAGLSNQEINNTSTDQLARPNFEENFIAADFLVLAIGDQIMVTGTNNDDGSITASRIMIGIGDDILPPGFGADNSDSRPQSDQGVQGQGRQRLNDPDGEQMPDFQNMTDAEREQMQLRFNQQGGAAPDGARRSSGQQGSIMVRGEILKKSDSSLTVKLADGGSKLVFIADSTEILQPKE